MDEDEKTSPKKSNNILLILDEDFKVYPYNKNLTEYAQELRRNMTPEEKHLWYDFLKLLPITVKRQYVIENYIVDFFIPTANIAIEIDGSQHFEPEAREADRTRDSDLALLGIMVVRYSNIEINSKFLGVVSDLLKKLDLTYEDLIKK